MLDNLILIEQKGDFKLYKSPSHFIHDKTKEPIYGWGNGYVSVPKTHPYYGKDYDDLPYIDVHGGVTYTDYQGDEWLIGFDCHHGMDTLENCPESYVVQEVYKLYETLKEVTND